jgi:hypothetical protein
MSWCVLRSDRLFVLSTAHVLSCAQLHSWLLAVTATHPKVGNVYDVDLK